MSYFSEDDKEQVQFNFDIEEDDDDDEIDLNSLNNATQFNFDDDDDDDEIDLSTLNTSGVEESFKVNEESIEVNEGSNNGVNLNSDDATDQDAAAMTPDYGNATTAAAVMTTDSGDAVMATDLGDATTGSDFDIATTDSEFNKTDEVTNDSRNSNGTTYADIQKDRLNNIIISNTGTAGNVPALTDLAKLTPLCKDYLEYMAKQGYRPNSESFEDFCDRTKSVIFYAYTDDEIANKITTANVQACDLSQVELSVLAQYLKVTRNVNLSPEFLQYYINFPTDFFDKIAFTFRTASHKEIEMISDCYDKPWYKDYIIPLFSLEEKDTPLLIKLMQKGDFNEKEALQYTNDLNKLNEYLTLKLNGGYVQNIFDKIGNNKEDIELYRSFVNVIGDSDIAQTLFTKSCDDKLIISDCLQKIHKNFPNNQILLQNGTTINLLDFLNKYENDVYFIDLFKGLSKGIFDMELYNAITLVQPDNKQITAGLLIYYSEQPALAKYYQTYRDVCVAIIANDIDRFGYDLDQFTTDMNSLVGNDTVLKDIFKVVVCFYYSELFDMSLKDYKQWVALFSQDCKRYTELINSHKEFDLAHFNKFWAEYAAAYFGFKNVKIDKDVKRSIVIKINSKMVEKVLPLDIFIYMDEGIEASINNNIKWEINYVTYDQENKILYIGKRNLYGHYKKPLELLKYSLEHLAEKETLRNYNIEEYGITSRTIFMKYFNMFVIGENIDLFYPKESSFYEMDKARCLNNFKINCAVLYKNKFSVYIAFDAILYVIYNVETPYSLLMYSQNYAVIMNYLKALRIIYYNSADKFILLTYFILLLHGKDLNSCKSICKNTFITILNDEQFNRTYNNPISLEIFLKHIDRFYKMAQNSESVVSVDDATGSICIDYKLQ